MFILYYLENELKEVADEIIFSNDMKHGKLNNSYGMPRIVQLCEIKRYLE